MLNKFIKKSSKLIAVVLAVTLAFSPLSYADITTFSGFTMALSDGTATIDIGQDFSKGSGDADGQYNQVGTQVINGNGHTINANRSTSYENGKKRSIIVNDLTINNLTMSNFGTDDANMGGVLTVNPGKILTIVNSNFTNNQIWANQNNGGAGVLYNAGTATIGVEGDVNSKVIFSNNAAQAKGGVIFNKGILTIKDNVEFNSNMVGDNRGTGNANLAGGGAIYNEGGGTITTGKNI